MELSYDPPIHTQIHAPLSYNDLRIYVEFPSPKNIHITAAHCITGAMAMEKSPGLHTA